MTPRPGVARAGLRRRTRVSPDRAPAREYSSLTLLPAVDVAGGQAVRLVQGAAGTETSYGGPLQAALAWQKAGAQWLHLVDLDAAFGRGSNAELLADVVGRLDVAVELSGGIRDDASLAAALATGCARVNIGTAALENPDWVRPLSPSTGRRSPSGWTCAGTGSRPGGGRRRVASWTRRSTGSTRTAAPASWSPTSPGTARSPGRT